MTRDQQDWINNAVKMIESGVTNKVVSIDKKMQAYSCGSVIRIDIKKEETQSVPVVDIGWDEKLSDY